MLEFGESRASGTSQIVNGCMGLGESMCEFLDLGLEFVIEGDATFDHVIKNRGDIGVESEWPIGWVLE